MDPVRGHTLLSSGQGRLPKGNLPGSFLLPGQAVTLWGECGPKEVTAILKEGRADFLLRNENYVHNSTSP
ncbi:hypothetical protein DFAR_3680004 [Desulfarculales bacterium]